MLFPAVAPGWYLVNAATYRTTQFQNSRKRRFPSSSADKYVYVRKVRS